MILPTINPKIAAISAALIFAFVAGWKVNGWRMDSIIKQQYDKQQEELKRIDEYSREKIKELQGVIERINNEKEKRRGKIKDVTDGRICFANADALQLWNEALQGVSSNSSGTISKTGGTSSTATDEEVLNNLNENAARWERLRNQMKKIIEWDEKTYDDASNR